MCPIYGTKDELEKLRKNQWCSVCGERVNLFADGKIGEAPKFYLACWNYPRTHHEGLTRHEKAKEKYMNEVREAYHMDSKALMTMNESQMLQRIGMAKFPQELTVPEKKLLAQVAITYGLDPLMGEVTLYQGKPWVSIDGRYRKAQETGKLDGVESRPATKQEHEDWQIPDGDYFFRAEVSVKGASKPFVGWGRVFAGELVINKPGDAYKPVVKNPQRMAEKRAEGQALRKAFHIPLPSAEDIGSPENEMQLPKVIVSDALKVDKSTGEVQDGEFREVATEVKQDKEATGQVPPNIGALFTWIRGNLKDKMILPRNYLLNNLGATEADLQKVNTCYELVQKFHPEWGEYASEPKG